MTALAGFWSFDGRPDVDRRCAEMLAAQSIYGPHGAAQSDLAGISVGRTLFRVLPEDVFDRQPLSGGDGRFTLVGDIRVDNRDELSGELGLKGQFADADVALAGWERWRENVLDRLAGDFAFAVFDSAERKLVLARDHAGQRPLHYHIGRDFFAFASMPKGLHRLPEIPRAPDEQRLTELIALIPEAGTRTYFKDICRVEPGSLTTVTRDGVTSRRYWNPQRRELRLANTDAYAEGLLHHFDIAVRDRLRGSGDAIGSHLSAGFDSSAVTTSAAAEMAKHNGKVVAFTSVPREGFDGKVPRLRTGNEGPIAAKTVAMYPNIEHVLIRPEDRTPLDRLDYSFFVFERPMLNLCNMVWSHGISDAAKARDLRVMLTGQMGNMTISYDGSTSLPTMMMKGQIVRWLRESIGLVRNGHLRILGVLNQTFGPHMPLPVWRAINRVFRGTSSDVTAYTAIRRTRFKELGLEQIAKARGLDTDYRPRTDSFESRLWVLNRVDLGTVNKGHLGGWGFDQRDPTCDRRLFEFCLSIPDEQFLRGGHTKALARHAFWPDGYFVPA
ncbi:MAG: asparagine synthetase B [Proteobacteria bacterium]|nr:asparagine synthetase B [Pseudomonadota bacterium]